ncbi:MAG: Mov34/MPN/PAD-1 family protein [Nostoc sp.]|uniref:Mov34/MPN/PAD-1 family protein n=1 Tax=Nostoc sp. TaxID=1180 RepID=UPI002FFC6A34
MSPLFDSNEYIVTLGESWDKQPFQGFPPQLKPFGVTKNISYAINLEAQTTISTHAKKTPNVEVGGLLLGEVYQQQESYFVNITDVLPAKHTQAGALDITFTGQTWLDLIADRSHYPEKITVGWYHSHPGIGVFFSTQDLFTHRSFFANKPWYIALVIDPKSGEQGVFVWDGDRIVSCPISSISLKRSDRSR